LLNAKAAIEAAPEVAALMARELRRDIDWEKAQVQEFRELAKGYVLS
jgi:glycerol-3-phosphate dehydrogenase